MALETYADGLGSIGARLKWYSYLFNPAKFLNNSELFGSLNPPWGYYPHNIFLDVMGNYGLPLFLITLTSAIYIFTNYLSLDEKNNSFFCTLLFSILLGSFISGASWDYYSIYISIPLILVTKRTIL